MLETLVVDVRWGVGTITLDRPEKGNAFNPAMLNALGAACEAFAGNDAVRVVVMRASGKHFCTGADISAGRSAPGEGLGLNAVLSRLYHLPKPTIAVVQGGCVGGGLGFAACCDVMLAEENAFFAVPELRVGIAPSRELMGLLARAMGHRALRRYGLSGERIAVAEAVRIGLVHQQIGSGETEAVLAGVIDAFLHNAPRASAALKHVLAQDAAPGEAILFPDQPADHRERTAEELEGVAAFREKRKPSWYVARETLA